MKLEKEKIEYTISDTPLKCDCGYESSEYRWSDPLNVIKHCIGMQCPNCKAIMLTQEDANKIMMLLDCIKSLK